MKIKLNEDFPQSKASDFKQRCLAHRRQAMTDDCDFNGGIPWHEHLG
jgi:hypothetical protein